METDNINRTTFKFLLVSLLLITLSGCATSSVLSPYPVQLEKTKVSLVNGDFVSAKKPLETHLNGADRQLYLMEQGRIAQIAHNYDDSIGDFAAALDEIKQFERKAHITASGAFSQVGSLVLNDNAIPYQAEGYEKVFLHSYQSLNYLFKHDLEAAGVEVRRANLEQVQALKQFEKELDQAENSSQARTIMANNHDYMDRFEQLEALAGQVKNSFQNAYTFYISGLIYEARGEENDAFIDYKKALEIYPDNQYLLADAVRLAKKLGMSEDLSRYSKRLDQQQNETIEADHGRIVVLFEQGFVPQKEQIKIGVFVNNHMQSLAFPTYLANSTMPHALTLRVPGKEAIRSQPIVNVSALAAKALKEKLPMILVRQVSRMIARQQTNQNMGDAAVLLTSLTHMLINNADLRSWLTLPANAQIMHTTKQQGRHLIELAIGQQREQLEIEVIPGKTTILQVIEIDGQLYINRITI